MPRVPGGGRKRRKTQPVEFPEAVWRKRVVDVLFKRPGKKGHISRFLTDADRRMQFIRRRRLAGAQATPTKVVREWAEQFPGKNLETVEKMIQAIKRFKIVRVPAGDLKYFYARRTAEDVIGTQTVVALSKLAVIKSNVYIHGCVDHALALVAGLRAKGIKAEFVREGCHSWVLFELDGKRYRGDPSFTSRLASPIIEVSPAMEKSYQVKEMIKGLKKGRDAWDVGLYSLEDYAKWSPEFRGEYEQDVMKEAAGKRPFKRESQGLRIGFFLEGSQNFVVKHGKKFKLVDLGPESIWRQRVRFVMREGQLVPAGGLQVRTSKTINEFARQFKGEDKKMLLKLVQHLKNRHNFAPLSLTLKEMERFYGKRTAHDIISTKTVLRMPLSERKASGREVRGCVDYCLVVLGVLKAKGLKAEFVREMNHSKVLVQLPDGEYIVDPLQSKTRNQVIKRTERDREADRYLEGRGLMGKGKDLWDLGIYGLEDFGKFWPPPDQQKGMLEWLGLA